MSAAVDFVTDGDMEHLEVSLIDVIIAFGVVSGGNLNELIDTLVGPVGHWT